MHGNVKEWCQDGFAKYPSGNVTDPTGPASGVILRVFRGDADSARPGPFRSAYRLWDKPDRGFSHTGFRVLRSSIK